MVTKNYTAMPTKKHQAPQLAQLREQILAQLQTNRPLVDSILGRTDRYPKVSSSTLLDQTAYLTRLQRQLAPADLADLLGIVPYDQRLALWRLIDHDKRGKTLLAASENIWDSLIDGTSHLDIIKAVRPLALHEQARLARHLPRAIVSRLFTALEPQQRAQARTIMNFASDRIGHYMDFELATVRPDVTLAVVQRYLKWRKPLTDDTDKLFIVDRQHNLLGELSLVALLLNPPEKKVEEVMVMNTFAFLPDDSAQQAANAFKRYSLLSAAVVDTKDKLISRVTIKSVAEAIAADNHRYCFRLGGVSPSEDLFASVQSVLRTRCSWLAINLGLLFIASRVIGLFEGTISTLVSLAALLPMVATLGADAGKQTLTVMIGVLAQHQVERHKVFLLLLRELRVAAINGILWGGIMGLTTWLMYHNAPLGGVVMLALLSNLLLAALLGVLIPLTLNRIGQDVIPAHFMITAITTLSGLSIFLGLATLLLKH
jgi:magnesium transporter